jgi:hypothetical protein
MLEEIDKLIQEASDVKKDFIKDGAPAVVVMIIGIRIVALQDVRRIVAQYLAQR